MTSNHGQALLHSLHLVTDFHVTILDYHATTNSYQAQSPSKYCLAMAEYSPKSSIQLVFVRFKPLLSIKDQYIKKYVTFS